MKLPFLTPLLRTKRLPTLVVALFTAVAALATALPAQSASAAGCHYFDYHATLSSGSYVYTNQYTVPSSSSCNDINIFGSVDYSGNGICVNVRVRFYPSGGGNYANSWKWHCNLQDLVIASNVANGTHYRVELDTSTAMQGAMYD